MNPASRIVQLPLPAPRAPLGAALDGATGSDEAPPVVLRTNNVVPFVAAKTDGSAAPPPLRAQHADRSERGPTGRLRWAACLAFALTFHAALAVALLRYWNPKQEQLAGAPLILVELAAVPVAPAPTSSDAPPGPQQMQTQAAPAVKHEAKRDIKPQPEKPVEKTASIASQPRAERPAAALPPPKPAEPPRQKKPAASPARQASAPSAAPHRAERTAAPSRGASTGNPDAISDWKSRLVSRLERFKHYPAKAQARGEHGVAQLAFSVDRSGRIHDVRIRRSSGSTTLDRATLALVARAQPLPPPPPEIRGGRIAITVPIRYNIR
jgi:periplasmic protein TonB